MASLLESDYVSDSTKIAIRFRKKWVQDSFFNWIQTTCWLICHPDRRLEDHPTLDAALECIHRQSKEPQNG